MEPKPVLGIIIVSTRPDDVSGGTRAEPSRFRARTTLAEMLRWEAALRALRAAHA